MSSPVEKVNGERPEQVGIRTAARPRRIYRTRLWESRVVAVHAWTLTNMVVVRSNEVQQKTGAKVGRKSNDWLVPKPSRCCTCMYYSTSTHACCRCTFRSPRSKSLPILSHLLPPTDSQSVFTFRKWPLPLHPRFLIISFPLSRLPNLSYDPNPSLPCNIASLQRLPRLC